MEEKLKPKKGNFNSVFLPIRIRFLKVEICERFYPLLAPFYPLLAPFCLLWAPFCLLWAPFCVRSFQTLKKKIERNFSRRFGRNSIAGIFLKRIVPKIRNFFQLLQNFTKIFQLRNFTKVPLLVLSPGPR